MKHLLFIILIGTMPILSCKKDKNPVITPPPIPNEGEIITTVELHFEGSSGAGSFTAMFRDPDGDGGNPPVRFDTIRLESGKSYNVTLKLSDETKNPAEDITAEIEEEADEHIFCFTPSGTDVAITLTDSDGTFPVGIKSGWNSGSPSTGIVNIRLRHQPGTKDGTCIPGDTDIDLNFRVVIQ